MVFQEFLPAQVRALRGIQRSALGGGGQAGIRTGLAPKLPPPSREAHTCARHNLLGRDVVASVAFQAANSLITLPALTCVRCPLNIDNWPLTSTCAIPEA